MTPFTLKEIKLIAKEKTECKGKVLITDNLEVYRSSIANILENDGFITATANCDFKTLEVLMFFHADIILIDCHNPGLSSFKCSEYILKIDPEATILFTSTDISSELKIMVFKAGGKGLLKKPFNSQTLIETIQRHFTCFRNKTTNS